MSTDQPVAAREMLAVEAPRGGKVHITSLDTAGRTACGKKCNGWAVASVARPISKKDQRMRRHVTCLDCKAQIFFAVKPRSRR